MFQFFVTEEQVIAENKIVISGSDVNHIKNVVRLKVGDRIRVSVTEGNHISYFCSINAISDEQVEALVESVDEVGTELPNKVILFQGLPKSDKMELIIQKMTELGVAEIYPVAMKNCVMKLDEKKADNKIKRWQTIAESAAKQSKRTIVPQIHMPISWKEAVKLSGSIDVNLVPYENERGMAATREMISQIKKGQTIGIFVGPEGGFAPAEIETLPEDMHRMTLGKRILRTETAGLATLAMIAYQLED